jgi:hypothetical protein
MGRTRQPCGCGLSLSTSAGNANLKASSRAQPAGVRHPLTSLPFFISALTCSVFFLETVLPRANDSSQTGWSNEHSRNGRSAAAVRQFITENPHPVYKDPSTLLTQVPHLPSCFSSSCFYFSGLMPMCDRPACAVTVPSFVNQHKNQKHPHPQKFLNSIESRGSLIRETRIDRRTTPQDFRSVQLPELGSEGCVSVIGRLCAGVFCGVF